MLVCTQYSPVRVGVLRAARRRPDRQADHDRGMIGVTHVFVPEYPCAMWGAGAVARPVCGLWSRGLHSVAVD